MAEYYYRRDCRLIWFMDKIQELTKEYKKRDYVSVEMKKEK